MLDGSTGKISDLVRYRLARADENLAEAKNLFNGQFYAGANNRIYYSIFNAILAVHALDQRATSSHKRAIGEFNRIYIHGGDFPKEYSKEITKIEVERHASDYDNFYAANPEEALANHDFAKRFLADVKRYCQTRCPAISSH